MPIAAALAVILSSSALGACGPTPPVQAPRQLSLRQHDYTLVGGCGSLPVYRTALTDSTFLDRGTTDRRVVLVTDESSDPTTAQESWPAPMGNLYFSYPYPGDLQQARAAVSEVIGSWWQGVAPQLPIAEGWDGAYGAHRVADGRFVTGLALDELAQGTAVGVDIHLGATPEAYGPAAARHVSLATLTGHAPDPTQTLWTVLSALEAYAEEAQRPQPPTR